MAAATSSGRPGRPMGVFLPAMISCCVEDAVSIQPGATAFTVIPLRATFNSRPLAVQRGSYAVEQYFVVKRFSQEPHSSCPQSLHPHFFVSLCRNENDW